MTRVSVFEIFSGSIVCHYLVISMHISLVYHIALIAFARDWAGFLHSAIALVCGVVALCIHEFSIMFAYNLLHIRHGAVCCLHSIFVETLMKLVTFRKMLFNEAQEYLNDICFHRLAIRRIEIHWVP